MFTFPLESVGTFQTHTRFPYALKWREYGVEDRQDPVLGPEQVACASLSSSERWGNSELLQEGQLHMKVTSHRAWHTIIERPLSKGETEFGARCQDLRAGCHSQLGGLGQATSTLYLHFLIPKRGRKRAPACGRREERMNEYVDSTKNGAWHPVSCQ